MKTNINQETLICSFNPESEKIIIDVRNLTEQYALISRYSNGEELVKMIISSKRDFLNYPYGHKLEEVKIYIVAQEEVDVNAIIEEIEVVNE